MKFTDAYYEVLGDRFKVSIHIDEETGEFSAKLPPKFCRFLKKPTGYTIQDDSLRGVKEQIKQHIHIRENQLLENNKEKVIVYQVFYNGDFKYSADKEGKKKIPVKRSDLNEDIDIGVGFKYQVLIKCRYKDRVVYKTVPHGKSRISVPVKMPKDFREVPWTKKREKFFASLEKDFQKLIEKLDRVFRFQKKSHIISMIDGGDIDIFKKAG